MRHRLHRGWSPKLRPSDVGALAHSGDRALAIDVRHPRRSGYGGRHRVASRVDGRAVWFESDDADLEPSLEAIGSALLVPALHAGRALRIEGQACDLWAANMQRLADEFRRLWYSDRARPLIVPEQAHAPPRRGPPVTALCFSGGVDAFHTLLAGGFRIGMLVYVVGYDVALRDAARAEAVERMVREVSREVGCACCVIRTSLRRHALVRAAPWLREFGGALASAGHLLASRCDRLLLSGDGLGFEHPEVGARASTDALFGSSRVAVEHVAPTVTRLQKIRLIAGEPLVQRHLRVCWKNVGSLMNCGQCEKCIRTMVTLDACGMLGRFEGFGCGHGLEAAIGRLPAVDDVVDAFYRSLIGEGLSRPVDAAVRRLLDRTAAVRQSMQPPQPRGAVGRLVRAVGSCLSNRSWRWSVSSHPRTRYRLLGPSAFAAVMEPLQGKVVGYVRPEGNVGDRLIEMAMIQLFAEFGIRWRRWRPDEYRDADGIDLLVFGGGGNMGTRYAGNYVLRTQALRTGHPLIILPQSFTSVEARPFAKVFVRERASQALHPGATLAPDLALGLQMVDLPRARRGVGVFLRRDGERVGRKSLIPRDPVRRYRDPMDYLLLASRYRELVTDRLHLAIAGMHAGRSVTLVANSYHKNRSMHETWLGALGCRFAESAR